MELGERLPRPGFEDLARLVEQFCARPVDANTPTDDLGDELRRTRRLINLLELDFARTAARFAGGFEGRDSDAALDYDCPVAWMREECRMTSHAGQTAVGIGHWEHQLTRSILSLVEGRIGMAHLGWLANTAETLGISSTTSIGFDERPLLAKAERLNVYQFRRECRHVWHAGDLETFVSGEVDQTEARRLRLTPYDNGCLGLDGVLDPEGGALLRTVLEPLARRSGQEDHREVAQRRADALVEICAHQLDTGQVAGRGSHRAHLLVTSTLETLRDLAGSPAAEMEYAGTLSGAGVQRLACDATISRVLVDAHSAVIDVGRSQRVVPPSTRRALTVRDKGCRWPGCARPVSWTQAHHLIHWADFGLTQMDNLILVCHRHHWMLHEGGYHMVRTDEGQLLTVAPFPGWYQRSRAPADLVYA